MKKAIFIFVIIALFCSCGDFLLDENFRGGDWFYLENKGATMPVWVKGNMQSEAFIIFLSGGPGQSSKDEAINNAFKELQKNYAFVYWEQRGSGISQGNTKPENLTIEQFVEDLEKIIILIQYKYNNPKLFLMGHSWGGTLGIAFLLNQINQSNISGWIEIDGGHNVKDGWLLSMEWQMEKASEQINKGNYVNFWEEEIAWYKSKPDLSGFDNLDRFSRNVDKLNGYIYNLSNVHEPAISLFFSSFPLFDFLNQVYLLSNNRFDLQNINLVSEMHKITIPSLILWGRHDGILPVELAQEAYDNLDTNINDKHIYIFENSAHSPFLEEPGLFVERIRTFIDKYK